MVSAVLSLTEKIAEIAPESKGAETAKVVAVPAISAKTAIRSMSRPGMPSVCRFKSARQASEYFCLLRFRT